MMDNENKVTDTSQRNHHVKEFDQFYPVVILLKIKNFMERKHHKQNQMIKKMGTNYFPGNY